MSKMLWLAVLCACGSESTHKQAPGSGASVGSSATTAGSAATAGSATAGSATAGSAAGSAASAAPAACLDERKLDPGFNPVLTAAFEAGVLRVCMGYNDNDDNPHRACVGLDPATGKPSPAGEGEMAAARAIPTGSFELRDGKPMVCTIDHACKPLGKRAAKAAKLAKADTERAPEISATSDGAVLLIDGAGAWNVAKDRKLKLAVPQEAADQPDHGGFMPIGRVIFGSWTPCAGPCTISRLYGADGKPLFKDFGTELGPRVIDDQRWAILSDDHLLVFDLAAGNLLHDVALVKLDDNHRYELDGKHYRWDSSDPAETEPVVPLGGNLVAVVLHAAPLVVVVDIGLGTVVRRFPWPICGAPDTGEPD